MKTIAFLQEKSTDALIEEFGIRVEDYPNRVVLNYDMIKSPKRADIVRECRGLILRKPLTSEGNWTVAARSFDRFFNYGECAPGEQKQQTALLHHPDLLVLEKVDGSLMNVYHEGGHRWSVASRGKAYAEGFTARENSFAQVFERVVGNVGERFKGADQSFTYIFELVSPETRVVTPYQKADVFMLGVRSKMAKDNYRELPWDSVKLIAAELGFKTPKEYKFNTLEEINNSLKLLPAMEEGFVCRLDTKTGVWRVKIKNPKYLAISHMRSDGVVSLKRVALLVLMQDYDEYLRYFPEDKNFFQPYFNAYDDLLAKVEELKPFLQIEDQKEFAMQVKDTPVASIMFMLRKGTSFSDAIEKLSDNAKAQLLEKFVER